MNQQEEQIRRDERARVLDLLELGRSVAMHRDDVMPLIDGGAPVGACLVMFERHAQEHGGLRNLEEAVARLGHTMSGTSTTTPTRAALPKPSAMDLACAAWEADRRSAPRKVGS